MGLLIERKPECNSLAFPWGQDSRLPTAVLIIKRLVEGLPRSYPKLISPYRRYIHVYCKEVLFCKEVLL